jgi:hypothetical protein
MSCRAWCATLSRDRAVPDPPRYQSGVILAPGGRDAADPTTSACGGRPGRRHSSAVACPSSCRGSRTQPAQCAPCWYAASSPAGKQGCRHTDPTPYSWRLLLVAGWTGPVLTRRCDREDAMTAVNMCLCRPPRRWQGAAIRLMRQRVRARLDRRLEARPRAEGHHAPPTNSAHDGGGIRRDRQRRAPHATAVGINAVQSPPTAVCHDDPVQEG